MVVAVKAIACELPSRLGLPLSRLQVTDIQSEVVSRGLVASISGATIWRWLNEDVIKPWTHRSWIFPRDPDFEADRDVSWCDALPLGAQPAGGQGTVILDSVHDFLIPLTNAKV